jgi:hypothetical protein
MDESVKISPTPGGPEAAPQTEDTARNGSAHAPANGAAQTPHESSSGPAAETKAPAEETSRVEQAEETVDRLASRVANATSFLGKKLMRAASRVREAAADFWAEAQSIRRGDQP